MRIFISTPLYEALKEELKKSVDNPDSPIKSYTLEEPYLSVETEDAFVTFVKEGDWYAASVGYRKSLAAVIATDDQIVTFVANKLLSIVPTPLPEPPAEPAPEPVSDASSQPEGVKTHELEPAAS